MLDVALKVGELLKKAGINITYTRTQVPANKKVELAERTNLANSVNADLFVSIHANSGGGTGTETLIYKTGTEAEKLAKLVQKNIVNTLSLRDRGIKIRTDLWVLKRTNMPAILVELAFVDNVNDAFHLKNSKDKFAFAIANGILQYLGKGEIDMAKFVDVPDAHWAEHYIDFVTNLGIMKGYEDGTFKPDKTLTRAEAAVIIKNIIDYFKK